MKLHRGLIAMAAGVAAVLGGGHDASAQDWGGFYVGASLGGAGSHLKWDAPGNPTGADQSARGLLAGVQAGYNWQMGNFVTGLEADYNFAGIKGQGSCPNAAFNCENTVDRLGSVRARAGWLVTPSALVYFTTGLGFTNTRYNVFDAATGLSTLGAGFSRMSTGLVLGAGAEYRLDAHWSLKGEYLHTTIGSFGGVPDAIGGNTAVSRSGIDAFKFGMNYRF